MDNKVLYQSPDGKQRNKFGEIVFDVWIGGSASQTTLPASQADFQNALDHAFEAGRKAAAAQVSSRVDLLISQLGEL